MTSQNIYMPIFFYVDVLDSNVGKFMLKFKTSEIYFPFALCYYGKKLVHVLYIRKRHTSLQGLFETTYFQFIYLSGSCVNI